MTVSSDDEPIVIEQQTYWSMVPEWITYHPKLSDGAKVCYAALGRSANSDRKVWLSHKTIAERLSKSTRSIVTYMSELRSVGALTELERSHDSPVVYHLEMDSPERRRAIHRGMQKSSSERVEENCVPSGNRSEGTQKLSYGGGRKLPTNESQEPESYKTMITSNARGPVENFQQIKDRMIRQGHGCADCDSIGVVEDTDGVFAQCRTCQGAGIIQQAVSA